MTHAMVFQGVNLDEEGKPNRWRVENSWGDAPGKKGYYVKRGILDWTYTGLTKYYGTWYCVQKGFLNWNYTGMTNYYGKWYYIKNGVLNWDYKGYFTQDGVRYYVKNGVGTVQ